jgi:hypothetical protein
MLTKNPPRTGALRQLRNHRESVRHDFPAAQTDAPLTGSLPVNLLAGVSQQGYLGPGTVVALHTRERLVQVRWEQAGKEHLVWARPAMAISTPLKPGDVALVLSQNVKEAYLIGILSEQAQAIQPAPNGTLAAAGVTVARPAENEVVQVRSKQGELVVEYHPHSGKTVVNIENGDLEFVTQKGSIAFKSAQKISLAARRLETQAETVVAKATNVYETVEELSQLQAGRTRTLVKGTCLLKARDAFLKAETDFKIDGTQIHLG